MMQHKEVVKEWIEKAEEDFGFAASSLENGKYYAQICFHFQQAVEKYLKAFIIASELEFRAVHNILELLAVCKTKEAKFESIEEACRYLNPFYINTRYPVHWPSHYDKETALKAKKSAEEVKECVQAALMP